MIVVRSTHFWKRSTAFFDECHKCSKSMGWIYSQAFNALLHWILTWGKFTEP